MRPAKTNPAYSKYSTHQPGAILHFANKSRGNGRPAYRALVGDVASPLLSQDYGQPDSRYQETGIARGCCHDAQDVRSTHDQPVGGDGLFPFPPGGHRERHAVVLPVPAPAPGRAGQRPVNSTNMVAAPGKDMSSFANYTQISCELYPATKRLAQHLYFNNPTDLTIPDRHLRRCRCPAITSR